MEEKSPKEQVQKQIINEVIDSTSSDYSDQRNKSVSIFDENTQKIIESICSAFEEENEYVNRSRDFYTVLFAIIVCILIGLIILFSFLAFFKENTSLPSILTPITSLVATVVSLLYIQFKYLFNRKENKLLDILKDILQLSSEHERDKKEREKK